MERWSRTAAALAAGALTVVSQLVAVPTADAARPRGGGGSSGGGGSVAVADVMADADWTMSAQRADGAITHYVDNVMVSPYLANFAAMGLARATEVTSRSRYADAAWRWLEWYQAHQDANGFVTDYTVAADGSLVSTGDMDSTDAYAGTFLLAARRTWKAAPDTARLRGLEAGIGNAVAAIEATQDTDGLTWAKPAWRVKYLMDQAEAFAGLRAAAELASELGDSALQQRASTAAGRMASGVETMWNPVNDNYDWAEFGDGSRQATDWTVLYPDAQEQMWAVAFGLATGTRARALVARFERAQPDWDKPAATATYDVGEQRVGYWPVTGWAYRAVGESRRASAAATSIRRTALSTGRAWPYTTGTGGQLIQLESADPRILSP